MEGTKRQIRQAKNRTQHPAYAPYLYGMIILGLGILAFSIFQTFYLGIGYQWLILAIITLFTSSWSIKIPSINARISIGDTLYFTNLLLFGIPAGVITAALDGLAGSIRSQTHSHRLRYAFFNVAAMACSSFLSGSIFFSVSPAGSPLNEFTGRLTDLLLPLAILSFAHYLLNSCSVATIVALEKRKSIFGIWRDGFLWTSITYFAGVAAATFISLTVGDVTPQVLGVAAAMLAAVYFTYRTYLNKVDEVRSLALYDSLTGLPNRILFKEQLEEALRISEYKKHMLAVMFVDLDYFKRINDTYGHGMGDKLLRVVASRLKSIAKSHENNRFYSSGDQEILMGRFGGDEFTIVIKNVRSSDYAFLVAQRFLQSLFHPCRLDGHEIDVSATIGISIYPFDGTDAETLLRNADAALYSAKDSGRNSCILYSQSMNDKASEKLSLVSQLRRAVDRKEFEIHYQPKMDSQNWKISGAEALIRWRKPTKEFLDTSQVIQLAEETGLIKQMGEWILRTVCFQISMWLSEGMDVVPVAVNLSPVQFRQANLSAMIAGILKETSLDPSYLEIELTESAIMEGEKHSEHVLDQLRELGVKVSIDDFGTGYSSLSRLKSLKLDALKIDRTFVKDCVQSPDDRAIITAIIAMAHSLDLKVIAEGVETEQQLTFLCERGCDEIQGFYFYKPIPVSEFYELLNLNGDLLPPIRGKGPISLQSVNQTARFSNYSSGDFAPNGLQPNKKIVLAQ